MLLQPISSYFFHSCTQGGVENPNKELCHDSKENVSSGKEDIAKIKLISRKI